MSYFVTGATGFIGRHLVERLLEREGDIHVLVREGSREKLDALIERWGAGDRVKPVVGDLCEPLLGVSEADRKALPGVEHFFHLAAIYDMTADETHNALLNVGGTQNAVAARQRARRGRLPPRLLGRRRRPLQGPLHRGHVRRGPGAAPRPTTGRSSRPRSSCARRSRAPGASTAPPIVVGNSKTGEMDKIDGPYYFFKLAAEAPPRAAGVGPAGLDRVGLDRTSSRSTTSPPRSTTSPTRRASTARPSTSSTRRASRAGEAMNTFARAGHAPHAVMRVDKKLTRHAARRASCSYAMQIPALKGVRKSVLADLGIPDEILEYVALHRQVRRARHPARAARAPASSCPPLESYADKLWDYWERNLDPDLFKDRSFEGAVNGRTVVITGASSGIGRAAALKIAAAGGIPILVARSLRQARGGQGRRSRPRGGTAYVYSADLSDNDSIDAAVEKILADHAAVDMLVNNAGRSIRRSVMLSIDRFHDYERTVKLNYLGTIKLILGAAAAHEGARLRPHRQRLLDRRADQPAALQRLRGVEGGAGRVHARGVARRRSATTSRSRRSTCRSCARR